MPREKIWIFFIAVRKNMSKEKPFLTRIMNDSFRFYISNVRTGVFYVISPHVFNYDVQCAASFKPSKVIF